MKEDTPFRITIEHWDQKVSIEVNSSQVTLDEVGTLLQQLLMAAGFDPDSIREMIDV